MPPLYPHHSSTGFKVVIALKQKIYRKILKSDIASIEFDSMKVQYVKYLLFSYDNDVLFVSTPMPIGVQSHMAIQ